jgi:hypothetical protein
MYWRVSTDVVHLCVFIGVGKSARELVHLRYACWPLFACNCWVSEMLHRGWVAGMQDEPTATYKLNRQEVLDTSGTPPQRVMLVALICSRACCYQLPQSSKEVIRCVQRAWLCPHCSKNKDNQKRWLDGRQGFNWHVCLRLLSCNVLYKLHAVAGAARRCTDCNALCG